MQRQIAILTNPDGKPTMFELAMRDSTVAEGRVKCNLIAKVQEGCAVIVTCPDHGTHHGPKMPDGADGYTFRPDREFRVETTA